MSKSCQILNFLLILSFFIPSTILAEEKTAISIIQGNGVTNIKGTIYFRQLTPDGVVHISGNISNLSAGAHGFHIHTSGKLSNGCLDTGAHFNPLNVTHGAPSDEIRHVGDLGNIEANAEGVAYLNITDHLIRLDAGAVNSIIGRGVVVHSDKDDLGLGGYPDSNTTGHAGSRVGCGIIELSKNNVATLHSFSIVIFVTFLLLRMSF